MKTRPKMTARSATAPRFALRPLSFAVCMAMSGAALALPQGGAVVAGNATIGTPFRNSSASAAAISSIASSEMRPSAWARSVVMPCTDVASAGMSMPGSTSHDRCSAG